MKKLVLTVVILIIILGIWNTSVKYLPNLKSAMREKSAVQSEEKVKVVTEESVVIDAVKKVSPSVVTIAGQSAVSNDNYGFGPFSIFGLPEQGGNNSIEPREIGSGFIIDSNGLIITNKHVVSDTQMKYQVITSNDKKYDVEKIYRDPLNDVAILKITPPTGGFKQVTLGDSSKLQVGQLVIAIGTALGEFRSTVTTGVISGLGRGITAGSAYEGFVERLDDVVQTDAAINPGNSGGPLLNSNAQVIGVNTAVSSSGQNIGFALPINIIKNSLKNFNQNGQFNRPYLGIAYKIISKDMAVLNDLPQGAYVQSVIGGSPAEKAGILQGDIITKIDEKKITEDKDNTVASEIAKKKIGDTITLEVWRDGKTFEIKATLVAAPNQ
jgi:serine protease Do